MILLKLRLIGHGLNKQSCHQILFIYNYGHMLWAYQMLFNYKNLFGFGMSHIKNSRLYRCNLIVSKYEFLLVNNLLIHISMFRKLALRQNVTDK